MRKSKRELQITRQGDGAVVFDKAKGVYYQVNAVGLQLMKGIADGKTNDELITEVEQKYSLDHAQAEADVSAYLSQLREMGLV